MSNLILSWKNLLVLLGISAALIAAQACAYGAITDVSVVEGQVKCEMQSIGVDRTSEKVRMDLECEGVKAYTEQPEVIASVFGNEGSLTCKIFKSGRAECDPRRPTIEGPTSHSPQ